MKFIIFVVVIALFSSCNSAFYEKEYSFSDKKWDIDEKLSFEFEISDTQKLYNLFFIVNNSDKILTSNIWIYTSIISPKGSIQSDSLQYFFCDDKGKWYGKYSGGNVSNKFLYQQNIKFPSKGKYRIQIEQGMRENDEPLVKSVALRIEEVN